MQKSFVKLTQTQCLEPFCHNYPTFHIASVKIIGDMKIFVKIMTKSFVRRTQLSNLKTFCHNYTAMSITSVKIIGNMCVQ